MKALTLLFGGLTIILGLAVIAPQTTTGAVSASEFQAGRIIDDDIFYDKTAMGSAQAVQSFINSHTPACDTWGTQPSGYGGTRAQYAARMGWHGPPYACLQNYHENPNTGETSFEKGGGAFTGGQSAGQIVWDAAQRHSINPQVLLVMLKKESAGPLFSDSWPLKSQYKYAMGYGCPDSGPGYSANCETSKAGFYKQMDLAAWQLRRYANYIHEYNYQPGRTNYIQYNPDPACGGKNVYIENVATASLYIYTPYVPSNAALSAYPGSTSCGAYGNRNFFMFFNEWFGSTVERSQLVRTVASNKLYLIVDDKKHLVPSEAIMRQLLPISGVDFVSQQFLDSKTTAQTIKRLIRSKDTGSIYLIDSGYKVKFGSCEMVADYGYDCSGAVDLTESQLNSFITADSFITNFVTTLEGKQFYVEGGYRREILDSQSAQQAGLSIQANRLSENSVIDLPYGVPIVRSEAILSERNRDDVMYIMVGSQKLPVIQEVANVSLLPSKIQSNRLDKASLDLVPTTQQSVRGIITDTVNTYVLSNYGKVRLPADTALKSLAVTLPAASIAAIPGAQVSDKLIVKTPTEDTLFYVLGSEKMRFANWNDVFSADPAAKIQTIPSATMALFTDGGAYIRPGDLVKSPSEPTVYMTLGGNEAIVLDSFDAAVDIGHTFGIRTLSSEILNGMEKRNGILSSRIQCATEKYIGVGGGIAQLSSDAAGVYTIFDTPEFCSRLNKPSGPIFLKEVSRVTIYLFNSGTKERITSYAKYADLGGNLKNTYLISNSGINSMPNGPEL